MERADEKMNIAEALPKERQPHYGRQRCVHLLAAMPDPGHISGVFLAHLITESSPMIMTSPVNAGAVARNSFTEVSDIVVQ